MRGAERAAGLAVHKFAAFVPQHLKRAMFCCFSAGDLTLYRDAVASLEDGGANGAPPAYPRLAQPPIAWNTPAAHLPHPSRMSAMARSKTRTMKGTDLGIFGIGLLLLGYMVAVEGEAGALPLGLVLVDGLGWAIAAVRSRRG